MCCTILNTLRAFARVFAQDLERFVTSAERGVVYFSMGSIVKGSSMPMERSLAMYRAFGRLKGYKVLWKWEDDPPWPEVPSDDVMFVPWMPQFDVLSKYTHAWFDYTWSPYTRTIQATTTSAFRANVIIFFNFFPLSWFPFVWPRPRLVFRDKRVFYCLKTKKNLRTLKR